MTTPIGFTRRELIDLMLNSNIHCSVDKFEEVACAIQQKVIDAAGPAVEIKVVEEWTDLRTPS
jgi:hypothetical protein